MSELKTFTDQMGRKVSLPWPPKRIVSLVPSQTEFLYSLGLDEEVVGLTKFCIHPAAWRKQKTVVGGTKSLHPERIRELQPDLIIGNREENEQSDIEALEKEFPVWMSDIYTLEDALQMMRQLGELTDRTEEAAQLVAMLVKDFASLPRLAPVSALYLIWRNPWMGAGSNTFIHQLMELNGFRNALEDQPRYPELGEEELQRLNPELVLLSSEPYPFGEKHMEELQAILPQSKILLVDGEMFSWYGSRLLEATAYFKQLQQQVREVL